MGVYTKVYVLLYTEVDKLIVNMMLKRMRFITSSTAREILDTRTRPVQEAQILEQEAPSGSHTPFVAAPMLESVVCKLLQVVETFSARDVPGTLLLDLGEYPRFDEGPPV